MNNNMLDKSILIEKFMVDISFFIPNTSISDCKNILNGHLCIENFIKSKNYILSEFNYKVVSAIVKKYKKLYLGEILNHTSFKLSDLDLEMITSIPQGGNWKNIPPSIISKSKRLTKISETGGRTTLYGRIDYNKPVYTITTYFNRPGNGTYVHPTLNRVLSVREAARFQTFPDNYFFYGNQKSILNQIGNALPVILSYQIANKIKSLANCNKSIDLFSGAGGMTYGFKLAGIKSVIATDIEENACITLKINSPEIPIYCGDITEKKSKDYIIESGINAQADIICGGPPCQGFSLAGHRKDNDPRNQLFEDFADIIAHVNPKIIVFENVEGILSYKHGKTYDKIIKTFSDLGYYTESQKLIATNFGIPQQRKRIIILCTRKDLNISPQLLFPEQITPFTKSQITAFETIYDLEKICCEEHAHYMSSYTSPIINFFKGRFDIATYLKTISQKNSVENYLKNKDYFIELSLF